MILITTNVLNWSSYDCLTSTYIHKHFAFFEAVQIKKKNTAKSMKDKIYDYILTLSSVQGLKKKDNPHIVVVTSPVRLAS